MLTIELLNCLYALHKHCQWTVIFSVLFIIIVLCMLPSFGEIKLNIMWILPSHHSLFPATLLNSGR